MLWIYSNKTVSYTHLDVYKRQALGSVLASLSQATKVIVKTPHEAMGVPTKEANAQGLLCTKQVLYMLKDQEFNNKEVKFEKEIIKKETRCIVDKCFEIGENDIACLLYTSRCV